MAVGIRMRRAGAKNRAYYHVVVTDTQKARNGRMIEKLGFYDPIPEKPVFQVKRERLEFWLTKGAKPSATVKQLIEKMAPTNGTEAETKPGPTA
jgi:small subunit ribosomal protein S16